MRVFKRTHVSPAKADQHKLWDRQTMVKQSMSVIPLRSLTPYFLLPCYKLLNKTGKQDSALKLGQTYNFHQSYFILCRQHWSILLCNLLPPLTQIIYRPFCIVNRTSTYQPYFFQAGYWKRLIFLSISFHHPLSILSQFTKFTCDLVNLPCTSAQNTQYICKYASFFASALYTTPIKNTTWVLHRYFIGGKF